MSINDYIIIRLPFLSLVWQLFYFTEGSVFGRVFFFFYHIKEDIISKKW